MIREIYGVTVDKPSYHFQESEGNLTTEKAPPDQGREDGSGVSAVVTTVGGSLHSIFF